MLKTRNIIKKVFFILLILFFFSSLITQGAINRTSTYSVDYKSKPTFSNNCSIENKQSVVKKVFDGDTILVRDEISEMRPEKRTIQNSYLSSPTSHLYKIRLLGIDAFEHDQNIYGIKGKDFLAMLILNKNICIETDVQKNDIYGRTLGYIFLNDVFVNEELVKNGLSLLYDFPPNIKYLSRLKKAQVYARQNMLGVWQEHNYIPETPAQWRHKHPFNKKQVGKI